MRSGKGVQTARGAKPGRRRWARGWLALVAATVLVAAGADAAVLFVRPDGSDGATGTSWAAAKASIGGAIAAAADGDEIWVAAGRYAEHVRIERPAQEVPVENVALYGGFAGTESDRDERNPQANQSIIDGTNSGIVVQISGGATAATRLDGFVVTAGRGIHGGGIKVIGSAPVIANNVIRLNLADGLGAGISVWGGRMVTTSVVEYPKIDGNTIVDNLAFEAEGDGGGIGINYASPEITRNVIARNRANQNGGGIAMYNASAPYIHGNYILANTANFLNGGSACSIGGGGIFATAFSNECQPVAFAISAPVIANNVIAANGAWKGGGIILISTDGEPTVVNNTIAANSGAGIHWEESGAHIANNLVAFNSEGLRQVLVANTSAELAHNNVYGNVLQGRDTDYVGVADPTGTAGNLSLDCLLTNLEIGELHLRPSSPCIDAGDAGAVLGATDVDGQPRIAAGGVDIGADEFDGTVWDPTPAVVYVRPDGSDANDGSSWGAAKATVHAGIAAARERGGEVWVATGTYVNPADSPIYMPAFVQVYGGFAGTESTRVARDWVAHPTVLDGGFRPPVVRFENAGYQVSRLDGVVVQNGGRFLDGALSVNVGDYRLAQGGGIVSWVNGPVVANSTIQHNAVGSPFTSGIVESGSGAGVAGYLSTMLLTDSTVQDNEVWNNIQGYGGGAYFERSQPTVENNVFRRNHAEHGSAMLFFGLESAPLVVGNTVEDHSMYYFAALGLQSNLGALVCALCDDIVVERNVFRRNRGLQGGAVNVQTTDRGRIESNVFVGNVATDDQLGTGGWGAGVLLHLRGDASGDLRVLNNTFVANKATPGLYPDGGGAVAVWGVPMGLGFTDKVVIANNVMADNSSAIALNLLTSVGVRELDSNLLFENDNVNLAPSASDFVADPAFVDALAEDFRLQPWSPAIDSGSATLLPADAFDAAGESRVEGVRVDRGAYEQSGPAALAVLRADPATVALAASRWNDADRRQDAAVLAAASGTTLRVVTQKSEAFKAQTVPGDLNGNGTDEIASLSVDADGEVEVVVKDGATGTLVSHLKFDPAYRPRWMQTVAAYPGSPSPGLAVLGVDETGRPRAHVRNALTGVLVSRISFGLLLRPLAFEVVGDVNGNGHPELAVLGVDEKNRVQVQVKDLHTRGQVAGLYFDRRYQPLHATGLDLDGDGWTDALALLGRNAAGALRVQVRDIASGAELAGFTLPSANKPFGLIAVPDVNGSGAPELAILQISANGAVSAAVRDALTGASVQLVKFTGKHRPRSLVATPDVSGNGVAELAYLGEEPDGRHRVEVRDVVTGSLISSALLE